MNIRLLSVYEMLLYYSCLIFVVRYIMAYKPKIGPLFFSYLIFIPLTILAVINNKTIFNIAFATFTIAQFGLIWLIFRGVRLRGIIFTYILIYSINVLLITVITTFVYNYDLQIDIIVNTVTVLLCVFICFTNFSHKVQQVIEWAPKHVLVITSLLLVLTSFLSVFVSRNTVAPYQETWNTFSNLTLISLIITICIISPLLILTSIAHNRLKALTANYEQQIQAQAEHYQNLAAANFETRRFKHDFKNMSIAMEALLAEGETAEALNLIRQWNDALNDPNTFRPAFDTGNGIADALLTDKSAKASACNTEITFQGAIPADFLSPTDLCVILGNTLDNAMEACQKLTPEMRKTIAISCRCSSGFLFVSITNPVSQKVMIQDNHVVTTKENKTLHGFGLYSLHSVVKKYNGEVRLGSTNDSFTTEIDLCIPTSVMFMQKTA